VGMRGGMLAIVAAVCFLLALLHAHLGDLNLVTLGLLFLALHLVWPIVLFGRNRVG